MKSKFRSTVFKRAHHLAQTTNKAFSICLSKAWGIYRLSKAMKSRVAQFSFEKKDGTLRRAKGTLQGLSSRIKGTGLPSIKTLNYWDVDSNGFRSFKIENFITQIN